MKLNFNVNNFIDNFSKECNKAQIKTFQKGEIITTYLENILKVYFLHFFEIKPQF